MTLFKNSGLGTDTVDVSTGNSALPDAWDTVVPGTGGTIKYQSGYVAFTPASAQSCYVQWLGKAGASLACAYRGQFKLTGYPSSGQSLWNFRSSGGGTSVTSIVVDSSGHIVALQDTPSATLATATTALSLNTDYEISIQFDATGGTTAGTLSVKVYQAGTIVSGAGISVTAQNLGTTAVGTARVGRVPAAGTLAVSSHKNMQFQTGSATEIPAWNIVPTANAGTDQSVVGGATVTLNGTGSADSDGTIATYAWRQISGTAVTLSSTSVASPTFTAPNTSGTLVFGLTVTDNSGASSTEDTVTIIVTATTPLKIRIGGVLVAAIEKVRIGGVLHNVTETLRLATPDGSLYSDTYSGTY